MLALRILLDVFIVILSICTIQIKQPQKNIYVKILHKRLFLQNIVYEGTRCEAFFIIITQNNCFVLFNTTDLCSSTNNYFAKLDKKSRVGEEQNAAGNVRAIIGVNHGHSNTAFGWFASIEYSNFCHCSAVYRCNVAPW